MDVEMEMNGHPAGFGATTNMEATTQSPPFETANAAAAASNAVGASPSLPVKPHFGFPIEASEEHSVEPSLQPVRQVETKQENTNVSDIAEAHPIDAPLNGDSGDTHVNENHHQLPESAPLTQDQSQNFSTQEPILHSSSTTSTSVESSAPSSLPLEAQIPLTAAIAPLELATVTGDASIQPEQAPTSDLRTSLLAEPVSSETALRIKMEKEKTDLAADPEIAQVISTEAGAPVENASPLLQPPISTAEDLPEPDSQHHEATAMDTSFDTALIAEPSFTPLSTPQPPPISIESVVEAPVPSPPSTPKPAPATLPAEGLRKPAPVPSKDSPTMDTQADHIMLDAPSPSGKISRERDEEPDEVERAAKRTKIQDPAADEDFKVPELPQAANATKDGSKGHAQIAELLATQNGATVEEPPKESEKITPPRLAHMKKIVSNLKKSNTSQWFRAPVDYVGMKIPNYPTIITHPMDLGTIDNKLKSQAYSSVKDFVDDFNLIVSNAVTFNGADHAVAQSALRMQISFNNQLSNMPAATTTEPLKDDKKMQKPKEPATRTAPPRRQSIPATSSTGAQPGNLTRTPSSGPSQTFALNPEGVPTIRRDSTALDGRPKRAIKPTRNHDIGSARPRKKKYELELKFCQEVLTELKKPRHWQANQYFLAPVDPVALQIPTYWKIIKKPMDLGTVQSKLDANEYEKAKDFEDDVRQIFKNCFLFNKPGELVYRSGEDLERLFNEKWEAMGDWLASKQPNSEPQSAGEDEDEDDESDEEEEGDSENERQEKIAQLQKQMEAMSKHMSELAQPKKKKKSTPPVVPTKKSSKSKGSKKDKQQATFPALQQKDKKKPVVKAKPEKERYVSYNEKQYISSAITQLDERRMNEALAIIQNNVPNLKNTDQTEIELDIDELPNFVLLKLLTFLKKYVPQTAPDPPSEPAFVTTAAPSKPKKNKPMTKHEQEAQIEELKGKLAGYSGGPVSPNAAPTIENDDSSGDDDDSEESEEE